MNSPANNDAFSDAFSRNTPRRGQPPRRRFAGLLTALRARLEESAHGVEIELEPMDAAAALGSRWSELGPPTAQTLVIGSTAAGVPVGTAASAADLTVIEQYGPASVVVDDNSLPALAALLADADVTAVRIDGPVEAADVRAIEAAVAAGRSGLEAELRALIAFSVRGERGIAIAARRREDAVPFVGLALRTYVATVTARPIEQYAEPEAGLIERALDRTGIVTVRPIETEIYSTAIDVGIVTCPSGRQPADMSLIYDVYSRTWHGD